MTTATRNAREVTVSKSVMEQAAAAAESAVGVRSAYDIAAEIEARVTAKLQAAQAERAELTDGGIFWRSAPCSRRSAPARCSPDALSSRASRPTRSRSSS